MGSPIGADPSGARRAPDAVRAVGSGLLFLATLIASYEYFFRTGASPQVLDAWFGTDGLRHIDWFAEPTARAGAPLHPISWAVYKLAGALARGLGVVTGAPLASVVSLPAVPVAAVTAVAVPTAAVPLPALPLPAVTLPAVTTAAATAIPTILAAVAIGLASFAGTFRTSAWKPGLTPALFLSVPLVLGIVPESHMLGGAFLCLAAIYAMSDRSGSARPSTAAHVAGTIAIGCTVSNLVLVALSLSIGRRFLKRRLLEWSAVAIGMLALWTLGVLLKHHMRDGQSDPMAAFGEELMFLRAPDSASMLQSIRGTFIQAFGIPYVTVPHGSTGVAEGKIHPELRLASFQMAAASFWVLGWCFALSSARRGHHRIRSGLMACGSCILWNCTLHSAYAPGQAYLFSAHTWPYLLVGLTLMLSCPSRPSRGFAYATLLACAAQTLVAAPGLRDVVTQLSSMAP